MATHNSKVLGEYLTYDDVLLVPAYSKVVIHYVIVIIVYDARISTGRGLTHFV